MAAVVMEVLRRMSVLCLIAILENGSLASLFRKFKPVGSADSSKKLCT